MFEYGQFKHAQREKKNQACLTKVCYAGCTLGGVVWNLPYLGVDCNQKE